DGIRDKLVTGVQTCALPISLRNYASGEAGGDGFGISCQGERGLSGRAGDGGGDWGGAAHYRAIRQHGGGYRRWDDRYRGDFSQRHCVFAVSAHGGQSDG